MTNMVLKDSTLEYLTPSVNAPLASHVCSFKIEHQRLEPCESNTSRTLDVK
jgi:hypothetical protein